MELNQIIRKKKNMVLVYVVIPRLSEFGKYLKKKLKKQKQLTGEILWYIHLLVEFWSRQMQNEYILILHLEYRI
jgi:hypothetical protein